MAEYQIETSPIWMDIKSIIHSGKKPVKFSFKGMLHTEKEDIPILKIISIDVVRDYVNNISDHIQIEFKMALGDYAARLYPYRTNIEFSIKKIQLEEVSGGKEKDTDILIERYKAIFLTDQNRNIAASELSMYDTESLNKTDILDVKLQLLNRALEPLRIKTVSGVYRQVTQKQVIHNLLAGESNKVLVDGKPSIDGIDIVEPDNKRQIAHTVIKDGIHIVSIPTYLQQSMNGVYNSGIGTYLQTFNAKKLWFVYPLYNTNRFDEPVDKIIFYAIPEERLPGIDRTYNKDGSVIKVLANSTKKYKDSADTDYMNHGVGFRMPNADSFMKKPVEMSENGPTGMRARLNYEVASSERKDGLNYAPMSANGVSSNPYIDFSKVAARNVARLDLVWENANYDMICPGMPCKYIFLSNNKPIELKGIILFVHAFTSLQGNGITSNTYKTVCQVTIVTEKFVEDPEIPTIKAAGEF